MASAGPFFRRQLVLSTDSRRHHQRPERPVAISWPVPSARGFCAAEIAVGMLRPPDWPELDWPTMMKAAEVVAAAGRPAMRSTGWLGVEAFQERAPGSSLRPTDRGIRLDRTLDSPEFRATAGADDAEYQKETGQHQAAGRKDEENHRPTCWPWYSGMPDAKDQTAIRTGTSWGTCRKATEQSRAAVPEEAAVRASPLSA